MQHLGDSQSRAGAGLPEGRARCAGRMPEMAQWGTEGHFLHEGALNIR